MFLGFNPFIGGLVSGGEASAGAVSGTIGHGGFQGSSGSLSEASAGSGIGSLGLGGFGGSTSGSFSKAGSTSGSLGTVVFVMPLNYR